MREVRSASGRFASMAAIHKLHIADPSSRYDLLVFDRSWRLLGPLNEWYRLRKAHGSPRTRDSYLAVLCPFIGFLIDNDYAWNAEPEIVREYTRQYLIASGCVVRRARQTDGYHIALTNGTAFSSSGLNLFIAAARDFYATLIEGEWREAQKRWIRYYGHPNPMYSELLLRWKREQLRALAHSGAPDISGMRGEPREVSAQKPVGYFRRKRDVWNPPVARDAEVTRVLIVAAILWMSDHATLCDKVIIRILLESGARLHEILGLTAGGYRRGRSLHVGVSALVRTKGSLGRETKPIHFEAETEDLLQRYIRTDRVASDREHRRRLEELRDTDALFLSRRGTQLSDTAFRARWASVRVRAERHFRRAPVPLPHLHPHLIRHAHATMRVQVILEEYPNDGERQRAAIDAVQIAMGWRSAQTAERYVHAISQAEAYELVQSRFVDRLTRHARDLPTLAAQVAGRSEASGEMSESSDALDFVDEAKATIAWITSLRGAIS
jgi:integrase